MELIPDCPACPGTTPASCVADTTLTVRNINSAVQKNSGSLNRNLGAAAGGESSLLRCKYQWESDWTRLLQQSAALPRARAQACKEDFERGDRAHFLNGSFKMTFKPHDSLRIHSPI